MIEAIFWEVTEHDLQLSISVAVIVALIAATIILRPRFGSRD